MFFIHFFFFFYIKSNDKSVSNDFFNTWCVVIEEFIYTDMFLNCFESPTFLHENLNFTVVKYIKITAVIKYS